ncbi:hypothetical protein H0G86_011324 [Trichoderma simmonsii]|uniref:Uncharacterized protein n=1 Tax=Trichoderma simmonsii TaxID=1491479 RepID=A0A8G0PKY1_9HYPO|nr:hypothetical protein H0G86_011324 [Trichoderma simmonsii]
MLPPGPRSGVAATSSSGVQGLEYRDLQVVEGVCSTLSSAKVRSLAKLILASRLFDSLLANLHTLEQLKLGPITQRYW